MLSKRGATSISILILVVMTLILFSSILFLYFTNRGKISNTLSDTRFISQTGVVESKINFYISQGLSLDKAAELAGNSEIIDAVSGRVRVSIQSGNKLEVIYEFQAKQGKV